MNVISSLGLSLLIVLPLTACAPKSAEAPVATASMPPSSPTEFEFARAALARNPQLEVLAADTGAQVVTVRVKKSGEVRALRLADIAAAPIADLGMVPPAPTATGTSAEPAASSTPAAAVAAAPATLPAAPALAPAPPPLATVAPKPHDPTADYTIQREAGRVKISGPGVTIESAGNSSNRPTAAVNANRRQEPIICDGKRSMYLDGQTVAAQGDAIVVRNGCELHIANSNITGGTSGIRVEDASVYVRNTTVEGGEASFESIGNARLYLQNSTFHGASRRSENTRIDDQGGNVWR